MTFTVWTGSRIQVPEHICSQATALWPRNNVCSQFKDAHVEDQFFVVAIEDDKVMACAHAGVYDGEGQLPDQLFFEENKYRPYWITHIVSQASPGVASQMLRMCEEYLKGQADKRPTTRRNCYVYTFPAATGFYLKNGYVAIDTPDHDENEESASYTWYDNLWLAKGMDTASCLDREKEPSNFTVWQRINLGLPVLECDDESDWYECSEQMIGSDLSLCVKNYRDPVRQQILDKLIRLDKEAEDNE